MVNLKISDNNRVVNGTPIAKIYGGEYNSKIIYLVNDDESDDSDEDSEDSLIYEIINYDKENRRTIRSDDYNKLVNAVNNKNPRRLDNRLKKIYDKAMEYKKTRKGKEIHLDDGIVQPIPILNKNDKDQTEFGYIAGPSGSGKSVYIAKWIIEYHYMFPNSPIYLFSRKKEDKTLDSIGGEINLTRIILDESFLADSENDITAADEIEEDQLSVDEDLAERGITNDILDIYRDSLCIFDDIDTIENNKVKNKVKKLRDDLLETGRSSGIYVLSTSHMICNYKNTRQLLNEASFVTIFPACGNKYQMKEYMKRYQGFNKELIDRIIKLRSRWVTIYTRAPQYVIYEHGVFLT